MKNWQKYLHPELVKKATILQIICESNGINIEFSSGFRTVSEQNELYAQGRTKPGSIVTNAPGDTYSSQHQWGIAVDFYLDMDIDGDGLKKDDAFNNSKHLFELVGASCESVGLGWGGKWSKPDMPHLYLKDWGSTTKLLKQKFGNPDNFMTSWIGSVDNNLNGKEDDFVVFVKHVQMCTGAKVDGIPGKETLSKTVTVSKSINRKHSVVRPIQVYLNSLGFDCGTVDGIAGPLFEKAVMKYQLSIGFKKPDGVMDKGKRTWKSLLRINM